MKKLSLLLCIIITVMCLCACERTAEFDYSDEDNGELISMENRKISGDEIGLTIVAPEETHNKVKVYKTEFTAEDFTSEIKDKKLSAPISIPEEEKAARYPEKVSLPQYDLAAFRDIATAKYIDKKGNLPEGFTLSAPQFSTKSFTGKLIISYTAYSSPSEDENGVKVYAHADRITLSGDLYTYEVE